MKDESLCQASESQVYLNFYSERSQGSSPRSGVKEQRAKSKDDGASSKKKVNVNNFSFLLE
ncbi:MAG: hypothetical protein IJB01_05045 [Bacteroidaceae bacterium]|nr:hypothetical protein [Bacteroidaceae bacterium]